MPNKAQKKWTKHQASVKKRLTPLSKNDRLVMRVMALETGRTNDVKRISQLEDSVYTSNPRISRDLGAFPFRGGYSNSFEQAWKGMEERGFQYGRDALEQVRLGWKLREETMHCIHGPALTQECNRCAGARVGSDPSFRMVKV